MNPNLKNLQDLLRQNSQLSEQDKEVLLKAIADADKQWSITDFKLERTEKVKRTTAILLEETIAELEQKRKAVEAQNRELEIEASLERVRARAMAMQKSDDLARAVAIIFEELDKLNIGILRCGIGILNKENRSVNVWTTSISDENTPVQISGDESMDSHPLLQGAFNAWLKQEEYSYILHGKDLTDYYKAQAVANFKLPDSQSLLTANEDLYQYYFLATFQAGGLFAFRETPFPDEAKKVMKRFAGVFNLTYKRFLDLQKAEAQAREAHIEAALERVRSRTMAMQRSDELQDAAFLLFQQVQALGARYFACGFNIWDDDKKEATAWMAREQGFQPPFKTSSSEDVFFHIREAAQRGESLFVAEQGGDALETHYKYMASIPIFKSIMDKIAEAGLSVPTFQIIHCAFFSQGYLMFISFEPVPDAHDIFKRFAKVFEQTYTRFLDLQKAEAQAREAKIEAALEKVRSRSLAMHKSDEIDEVLHAVFEKLKELDVDFYTAIIILFTNGSKDIVWWLESEAKRLYSRIAIPYTDIEYLRNLFETRENGMELFSKCYLFEEKNKLFHHLFDFTDFKNVPEEQKKFLLETDFATMAVALTNNTGIHITSYSRKSFSEQDHEIIKRFAKVFEQAYTRFLDLQKAEAQARESQIELGLERVRSRAMAMHKTDELLDAAELIYKELTALGITSMTVSYAFVDEEEKYGSYYTVSLDGKAGPFPFVFPHTETKVMRFLLSNWKEQVPFGVIELDEEDTLNHQTYIAEQIQKQFAENSQEIPFSVEAFLEASPKKAVIYNFNFAQGYIFIIGSTRLTTDQEQIVLRFTKVFELTYRRFLDLKQAEAQARESQIQLALERVRARTMAMQKSGELAETASLLFQQIKSLGIETYSSGFTLWDNDDKNLVSWICNADGSINPPFRMPANENAWHKRQYESWKKGEDFIVNDFAGEEMQSHYRYLRSFPLLDEAFKQSEAAGIKTPERQVHNISNFSHGNLLFITFEPCPEFHDIFKRFAKVFEQTYTRFLDLQKAEAQAREAKIEAALERVRGRAMAMHTSQELKDVALELRNQMGTMAQPELEVCAIHLYDESPDYFESWAALRPPGEDGKIIQVQVKFPKSGIKIVDEMMECYHLGKKDYVLVNEGEKISEWFNILKENTPEGYEMIIQSLKGVRPEDSRAYWSMADFDGGSLIMTTYIPPNDDARNLLRRFANVFGLAYRRFKDLKNAEAQAREAQIELGLERVRARAMAMQKSQELKELIGTVSTELGKLDIILDRCFIITYDTQTMGSTWWMANPETPGESIGLFVKHHEYPPYLAHINAWKERKVKWEYILEGEVKKAWDKFLFVETELSQLPDLVIANMRSKEKVYLSSSFNNFGYLTLATLEPLSSEQFDIMHRFAKVFDLTYTRFNDLQKAEAQAREAQIELGLERVRARAMAMQKSYELKELIGTVFTELTKLDLVLTRCLIMIFDPKTNDSTWWMANSEDPSNPMGLPVNYHEQPPYLAYINTWQERKLKWQYILEGKNKVDWDDYIFSRTGLSQLPDFVIAGMRAPERVYLSASFNTFGCLNLASLEQLSNEHFDILLRFAKVFDLTYTRFNDLKQAEAQAREATIEAALEKVRGKAMSMHNSNDLSVTTSMIIGELRRLGITPIRCGVGIINKETHKGQLYTATSSAAGDSLSVVGWVLLKGHRVLENIYEKWSHGEDYFPELSGDSRKSYYEQLLGGLSIPLPDFKDEQIHYGHFFSFSVGCLYAWSEVKYNDDEIKILKRFASIIDLTFRRYFELQKSETIAKEAVKQAALDRIRADIASMRSINDLDRITPLIWNELTILGIPFIRCGVFIMDESHELIHTFLSTPDGKAIAAFHLSYDTPGKLRHVTANWKLNKNYIDRWDESEFKQFADILVEQGTLVSAEQYLKTIPPGGFYLHFLPFLQGMLYVGNTEQLNEEQIELIQHVADAFSTAYARYEDFNKLEVAKQQVDKTLADLKQAQAQLIQSEKMASLGELTAGIAHEIQNPLNFVNNFSEVNTELIEEMKDEIDKGNLGEVKTIAEDIKANEQKINYHGKRADTIVKGMLQHSRSSSGLKEPTNLNALADEYLRLAYHGLRAKESSFNASMKTDYDESIGNISIIPQDIGRVILNLITNAFYAVNEKKKQNINGYEPTVSVSTKKLSDKVEVRVKDNGNGIPQKVFDKIFQPFFTTKPTGQGTGLGLSLSYDIVKAHGGEIKVNTKEGEGTEFIIQFPATE